MGRYSDIRRGKELDAALNKLRAWEDKTRVEKQALYKSQRGNAKDVFVIAVAIHTNVPEGSTWRFAGNVRQKVSTGIVFGGNQDASFNRRYALFLDKINLVVFPPISTNYSISIQVPDWFGDANLTVWRYTGPDFDSDLARIESKIDGLNNFEVT